MQMRKMLLSAVMMALLLPSAGANIGAAIGAMATVAVATGSWLAFDQYRYLLDPTWPIIALALVYSVQTVLSFRQEERQRSYIHTAFDRYLSPEMVSQIADNPDKLQLGGEEREIVCWWVWWQLEWCDAPAPELLECFLMTAFCELISAFVCEADDDSCFLFVPEFSEEVEGY